MASVIFTVIRSGASTMMRARGKPTIEEMRTASKLLTEAGINPTAVKEEDEYEIDTELLTVTKKPRTTEPPVVV